MPRGDAIFVPARRTELWISLDKETSQG